MGTGNNLGPTLDLHRLVLHLSHLPFLLQGFNPIHLTQDLQAQFHLDPITTEKSIENYLENAECRMEPRIRTENGTNLTRSIKLLIGVVTTRERT